jgi:excisionase family DNA binding protein
MNSTPADMPLSLPARGLTVKEVARYLRVSPDKVRAWIKSGRMGACNTSEAVCGKPRFIVLPHHLAEFERQRSAAPPPKPGRSRTKRTDFIDFYPD